MIDHPTVVPRNAEPSADELDERSEDVLDGEYVTMDEHRSNRRGDN